MNALYDPDDIEPLDADERLDFAYGHYHIGRDDETRDELALFFEERLLPDPDFFERGLWSIVNRDSGRLMALSEYASTEYSDGQLAELFCANILFARTFDGAFNALSIVVVELAKPAVAMVDTALRVFTAYVGYGNISCPSSFRSIITANQEYF